MPTTRTDSIQQLTGFPPLVKNVPAVWPTRPTPDKISLLFNANSTDIYHKFSPYTSGDDVFGIFPNKQPFVYRYVDEGQNSLFAQIPAAVKTLASAGGITQDSVDDVVRVSKFLISPMGIIYNTKQLALQRGQSFDETRLYNPLTPILATVKSLTFGIGDRPMRHIEGGIIGGLLSSVAGAVGINMANGFKKPDSTAGTQAALPTVNSREGKGLMRGGTAANAMLSLQNRWSETSPTGDKIGFGDALSNLGSSIASSFKSFFGGAPKASGEYRSDEGTYELMRTSKGKLDSYTKTGDIFLLKLAHRYYPTKEKSVGLYPLGSYGHDVIDLRQSAIMKEYFIYKDPQIKLPSKFNDPEAEHVKEVQAGMEAIINGINSYQNIGAEGTLRQYNTMYVAKPPIESLLMSTGDPTTIGYDAHHAKVPKRPRPVNEFGATGEYNTGIGKLPSTLDRRVNPGKNLRFSTTFTSDGMNQLKVLASEGGKATIPYNTGLGINYKNWTEYKPYEDDLIAFFFYDVVNQKYIPFRATVKGITEGNAAIWDELRFIGRADQLYSYNGFSRTLSFTFNIVVNSISELLPTWNKINYLASSVKPSNYTTSDKNGSMYSRFIVPPMFMVTIGDLYKFQPMVITSLNVNIPDDASWETLNEANAPDGWNYLNGIITIPPQSARTAQLPKEVEIAVTANLLEKERAIVGAAHFGHAPLTDEHKQNTFNVPTGDKQKDYLPAPTEFSKHMREFIPYGEGKGTATLQAEFDINPTSRGGSIGDTIYPNGPPAERPVEGVPELAPLTAEEKFARGMKLTDAEKASTGLLDIPYQFGSTGGTMLPASSDNFVNRA